MGQIRTREESSDFPLWAQLGDHPWYLETNETPQDIILVEGREVQVTCSLAQGIHIIDMEYWPRWVETIGILAIPLIWIGMVRPRQLSLHVHEVDLLPTSSPICFVRQKGFTLLRTTNFELAREVVRHQIARR